MDHGLQGRYKRVRLRPLAAADIEPLRLLRNREREWFKDSQVITAAQQQQWFASYLDKPGDYMFAVEFAHAPYLFIGAVALYDVDEAAGEAEFGRIIIDSEAVGGVRGLGVDTTQCVCAIGFEQLDLRRIHLEVLAGNERAIRTYERAGFKRLEPAGGQAGDGMVHMGICRP
jgi:RimJ/RimL family protein N-acetyltransferase